MDTLRLVRIIVVSLPKSHEKMMLSVPREQDVRKLMEQLAIKMTHCDTIFFPLNMNNRKVKVMTIDNYYLLAVILSG